MTTNKTGSTKKISLFGFFALTASMVLAVYAYPTFATAGLSLIFFLLLGGIFWFLPVSMASAEMATIKGFAKGGVFTWSGKILGERWGFANIFFQWFQITVDFVTMIYFILGTLSFAFHMDIFDTNPMVKFLAVLIIFWTFTLAQFRGPGFTALISKIGFIVGIIIPVSILFVLTIMFFVNGGQSQMSMDLGTIIPDFAKVSTLVVFVSFILEYSGIEASATLANEMKNVKRNYPIAIAILIVLVIILNAIGGISIGAIVPEATLGLSTGVIQGFQGYINYFFTGGMDWLVKLIAVFLVFGILAKISAWVVGPAWGMLEAGKKGLLPKKLSETNKYGVPTKFLIMQGIIVSIWAAVLTFGGGGNNVSFFTAIALTVVIYTVGYIIFFVAYLKLIIKHNHEEYPRTFEITKNKTVKIIMGVSGLALSLFALGIAFVPPAQLVGAGVHQEYLMILGVGFVVVLIMPFIIYHVMRKINPLAEGMTMMPDDDEE